MKSKGGRQRSEDGYSQNAREAHAKGMPFASLWKEACLRIAELRHDLSSQLRMLPREIARRLKGKQEGEINQKKEINSLFREAEGLEGRHLQKIILLALERLGDLHKTEIEKMRDIFMSESKDVDRYTYKTDILYPSSVEHTDKKHDPVAAANLRPPTGYTDVINQYVAMSALLDTSEKLSPGFVSQTTAKRDAAKNVLNVYLNDVLQDLSIPIGKDFTVSELNEWISQRERKDPKSFTPDRKKKLLKNLHYALGRRRKELEGLKVREIQRQILERMVRSDQGDTVLVDLEHAQQEFRNLCSKEGIADPATVKDFPPDTLPFETSFYPVAPEERLKKFLYPHIVKQYLKKSGKRI